MDYENFARDANHKKRDIKDLARFIRTRTDQNPNYSLLFGAGCSISSGVRSATQLTDIWRRELYISYAGKTADLAATIDIQRSYLKEREGSWYYPEREYSSLFEKRYDLQRQRRMFVETEVAGKTPSIGYAYLTALMEQNYFNTIFTTNFDDILNEAFYIYSAQRPIVCAHDSSINSITVTSKRPKIIKIHGDYLFDDLKSTVRETENLEQNIKAKFMEFAKDYGLIVVGYSGGDRSVMDVLSSLLRNEEFLKNGIYWCIRPGTEISEELRKLIWRDRVYFVEIEGYDELFAELFNIFNDGEILPTSAISIVHRPSETTNKLLASATAFPTTSPILMQARERLERQSKRTNLVNLIVRPDHDEKKRAFSADGLEDDELAILAEIQNMVSSNSHERAIELGRKRLKQEISRKLKRRLLQAIASAHRSLNQTAEALRVADELIELDPKKASHYLLKAQIKHRLNDKLECIEAAIAIDPFSVQAHLEKARHYANVAKNEYGEARVLNVKIAHEEFSRGIELNPSVANRCWLEKFNLWESQEYDKSIKQKNLEAVISELKKQNPFSVRVLSMRRRLLSEQSPDSDYLELVADLQEAKDRNAPDMDLIFDQIQIKAAEKTGNLKRLQLLVDEALGHPKLIEDSDYSAEVARILREKFGRDSDAIALLERSLAHEFDADVLVSLISSLVETEDVIAAETLLKKWERELSWEAISDIRIRLAEAKKDFDSALKEAKRKKEKLDVSYAANEHYFMLCAGHFREVEQLLRTRLEKYNFTHEADVDTINYELSKKKQNQKISVDRLTTLIRANPTSQYILAGANAVLGKKPEMLQAIRQLIKEDQTFRFQAARWPAFDDYRSDAEFVKAISVEALR